MRTLFLGSPPFAVPVLEQLLASRHEVPALVTPPDRPRGRGRHVEPSALVRMARERGVPVLQPERPRAGEHVEAMRALAPDVLAVASYGVILPTAILDLAPHGALNVHASLLPRHRGASPVQAAILCGDAETGVTIQRIVLELDSGDVLLSRHHPIRPDVTAGELTAELAQLGGEALVEALDALEAGRARFTPQDPSRVTFARKLKKEHGRVDFARPARELERAVRALQPWPGAHCLDPKGRELTLASAAVAEDPLESGHPGDFAEPGTIVECRERLVVATGEGALEIRALVPAGKRAMTAAEYLRGARLARGERMRGEPQIPSFISAPGCA